MSNRFQRWLFAGSLGLALLLQMLPMPQPLAAWKPWWLGMVLVYWSLESPQRAGLGLAFLLGLAGDVLAGELLGEQAMRLLVMSFIVLRFRSRIRFFPLWQQALAVFALLLNDRVVVLMIGGFAGLPTPAPEFWIAPVVGFALWPVVFLLLDGLRLRARSAD